MVAPAPGNTTQKQVYLWWSPDNVTMVPVSATNPLPVTGGGGGGGGAVTVADGADVTLGSKADARSTATDTTPVTEMSVLKEISFMEQNPASRAVTNAGTFATQATQAGTWNITNVSGTVSLPTNAAQETGGNLATLAGAVTAGVEQTNLKQVNGVTTLAGAGAVGTGAQRVAIGTDTTTIAGSAPGTAGSASSNVLTVQGVASMTKLLVTPDSVALPANQSVNVAQINGITPLMGNGTTGTGSQRTTNASDNSAIANWGHGATAATVPANAVLSGMRGATANPSAVTDGQSVATMADKLGRTITVASGIRDQCADQTTSLSNTTAETTIVTQAASIFNDILSFVFANTGASATEISLRDTTAGSVRMTFFVPAGDTRGIVFQTPLKQTTVNTNWTAQCATATTAMKITAQFVKNI